jgi:hypothetical protein
VEKVSVGGWEGVYFDGLFWLVVWIFDGFGLFYDVVWLIGCWGLVCGDLAVFGWVGRWWGDGFVNFYVELLSDGEGVCFWWELILEFWGWGLS